MLIDANRRLQKPSSEGIISAIRVVNQFSKGKRELIRINLLAPQQVVVGRHKDALGHWVQDTGIEYRKAGWIWAHLEDNVVTSVDVHAH